MAMGRLSRFPKRYGLELRECNIKILGEAMNIPGAHQFYLESSIIHLGSQLEPVSAQKTDIRYAISIQKRLRAGLRAGLKYANYQPEARAESGRNSKEENLPCSTMHGLPLGFEEIPSRSMMMARK
jgi:hypothetical protein